MSKHWAALESLSRGKRASFFRVGPEGDKPVRCVNGEWELPPRAGVGGDDCISV